MSNDGQRTGIRRLRAIVLAAALAVPITAGVITAAPADAACTGLRISYAGIVIPLDRVCTLADDCLEGRICPKPGDLLNNSSTGT